MKLRPTLLATALAATLALALTLVPLFAAAAGTPPSRLRRADSFLGVHFDFHAGPNCKEVGRNTTPAMIDNSIDLVQPDYLQIDCKGHPGYTSYPTKEGNPVPGFVGDPLRTWREVTARRGVALFMHYSGVWDDGECWASVVDYGPAALAAFTQATGIAAIPRQAGAPHWFEFLQFHREAFRRYLRHYIDAVNTTHPSFQICSNWAFTDHMPELVSAPVAFLSGDYSPDDSVLVHLVNTTGPHATAPIVDAIAPTGPIDLSIRHSRRPASVTLEPSGRALSSRYRDGKIEVTVPAVALHDIVVVTP